MSARYVIATFQGDRAVFDTAHPIRQVVAVCGTSEYAELVAGALNANGLVDGAQPLNPAESRPSPLSKERRP